MLRSPHAHARFSIDDLERVRAMPGVRLVLTAADVAELGPLPTPGVIPGPEIKIPVYPILAKDVVRHVGDAIAFVVADTLDNAKDAAEAITVDWQPLPHVIGAVAALAAGAPQVWPDRPGNLAFETEMGDAHATKAAFAQAARTVALTIVNQRLVTNYLDTRGVIAEYDGERYTLTLGSQGSHIIRDIICGAVLKLPLDKMRVVTPDVGGGFGTKLFPYREYALAAVAAERLRQAGEMGCRAHRAFSRRQPRPRQHLDRAAGARRQGPLPRARTRYRRRHGRLSVVLRALHSLARRRHGDRRLRYSGRACAAARAPIPTPFRSMPIAARAGRKPPI